MTLFLVTLLALAAGFAAGWLAGRSKLSAALGECRSALAAAQARLETEREHSRREREAAADALRAEFKAVAHDLSQTEAGHLRDLHAQQLHALLDPLGRNIEAFRQQYVAGTAAANQHIDDLIAQTAKVGHEASALSRALRANTKMQGDWGEAVLHNTIYWKHQG